MMLLLKDKVAVITGASAGIGKAIALKFADEGALVVLTARNQKNLEALRQEIEAKGQKAMVVPADLRRQDEVENVFSAVLKEYGRIDILVNNAGITKELPLAEMPMEMWDEILETNLRAVVLCTKAALPPMIAQRSGNIVNIASSAGVRGLPGSSAYSASKAAVIALTQSVGDENRLNGLRVNVICPGPVDTEMFQKSSKREYILKQGGDVFEPETMANAALFLASDMSKGMNSQTILIRGFNRW
ncbi:MAG: SDR family NAD(P)-dependent oxidoreductase [Christensenellales bacterium]